MHFVEQPSGKNPSFPSRDGTAERNYYAFFDKAIPENLAANRLGILTPQQRDAIERRIADHKSTLALFFVLMMSVALFVLFFFWMVDRGDGIISWTNLVISGGIVIVLLGVFAGILAGDLFLLFSQDDLAGDGIVSAVGKVLWKGNRYRAYVESRQLRSLRRGPILPPPGNYRFYYLPGSGLVVMAEEIGEVSEEDTTFLLLQVLAKANHFSLEDLHQNHKGLLSDHQINRLMLPLALDMLVVLSSIILGVSVLFKMLGGYSSGLFFPLLLVATLLILRLGLSVARFLGDLWNGKVRSREGLVVRKTRQSRYYRSYYYVLGSREFQVSDAAYHALIEGKPYCIYYTSHSKRLVSIEPL